MWKKIVQKRPKTCRLCGSVDLWLNGQTVDADGHERYVYACGACHCLLLACEKESVNVHDELGKQIAKHERLWTSSRLLHLQSLVSELRRMLAAMKEDFGEPGDGRRIIEIGAGRGVMLKALLESGYDATGCEPSVLLREQCLNQLKIPANRILPDDATTLLNKLCVREEKVDMFVLWHVLEHLHCPMDVLQMSWDRLKDGGKILIQVPMLSSQHAVDEHLFFMTPATLERLQLLLPDARVHGAIDETNLFLTGVIVKPYAAETKKAGDCERFMETPMLRPAIQESASIRRAKSRGEAFASSSHNRHWWHRMKSAKYEPPIYSSLTHAEWSIVEEWFRDTEARFTSTGEAAVPLLSLLSALIAGNGIERIVQCGHYAGYSTLMIGFLLRKMAKSKALFSIDINPEMTEYTKQWVRRGELEEIVELHVADSGTNDAADKALEFLGGAPQLVFIDSSHQYAHTIRELDLWYERVSAGGLLVLHDVSIFAATFDTTRQGGVNKAVKEWCSRQGVVSLSINSFVTAGCPGDYSYADGCGVAVIQKGV